MNKRNRHLNNCPQHLLQNVHRGPDWHLGAACGRKATAPTRAEGGRRGCLDALAIDAAVAEETKIDDRDLSVGWIDYQKAFDSVPHQWLRQVLRAIRAPRMVRRAVKMVILLW